jgi:hypothetical protein
MAEQQDTATENARKRLAEEKKVSDKVKADAAERLKGKPTPTQEENDLAALGAHIVEHEPDGSDLDPNVRQIEAGKPSGAPYQTRQSTAQHHTPAPQHRSSERSSS